MNGRLILNYSVNFLSAVTLIYLSKYVFRQYPISSLTFTVINCFLSSLFSSIILQFLPKPSINIPSSTNRLSTLCRLLLLSGFFSTFVILSNLSLQHNTIGTYQIIKLQVPPTLMLIEWLQLQSGLNSQWLTKETFSRNYSPSVIFCFGLIFLGTFLKTYHDFYVHPLGITYACISVVCNALYQAMIQSDKAVSIYERTRLLQHQSLISWILLFPCWCISDASFVFNWYNLLEWHVFVLLVLCGILAFLVNASVIWCIKDDTAIGYNMVGQFKTLLIVLIGSVIFNESFVLEEIISILITILGCVIYIYITYRTEPRQNYQQQEQQEQILLEDMR